MTPHLEVIERIEQSNAYIEKLFYSAASVNSSAFLEFFEDMNSSPDFTKYIPDWDEEITRHNWDDFTAHLYNKQLLGFFAECSYPVCRNFNFQDGKPIGWSSSLGHTNIFYVYGETIEELLNLMDEWASERFRLAWQKELSKQQA